MADEVSGNGIGLRIIGEIFMADMTLACGDEADAEHIPGDTDGVAIGEFVEGQFFFADRLAAVADVIFIEEGPVPAAQVLQECAWRADIQDAMMCDEVFSLLMGDKVEPRREFIEKNAKYAENIDA